MEETLFNKLMESLHQHDAFLDGKADPARVTFLDEPDPRAIRRGLGLTQKAFAALVGISIATLQGWEQGRRRPQGAERQLLRIAVKHPEVLLDLQAA